MKLKVSRISGNIEQVERCVKTKRLSVELIGSDQCSIAEQELRWDTIIEKG